MLARGAILVRLSPKPRVNPDLVVTAALIAAGALIYLPYLGAYPLWDPWEPHYSQVAWEMQNHGTWIEPYYRNADNWWSKPILMLWLLRASFALLWDSQHAFSDHELAARLPFALLAIAGGVLQYDWVRRLFGRAVGALAALVLLTASQYVLIGRQVMADMPMLVAYSSAMGYLAVGLIRPTRNLEASWLHRNWPFLVFWSLLAMATLAKGFLPLALGVLVLVTFTWITGRDGLLDRCRAVPMLLSRTRAHWGIPLFLLLAAPWYLYMTARHGRAYWDQFLLFHHLERAKGEIHLPSGTFDFYLRHLGFGLFPWTGFFLGGLVVFLASCRCTSRASDRRNRFVLAWIAPPLAFFMVNGTKFAHYSLPVIPPCTVVVAASLVGVRLNQRRYLALTGLLAALVTLVLANDIRLDVRALMRLVVYYYNRPTPFDFHPAPALMLLAAPFFGVAVLLTVVPRLRTWHASALVTGAIAHACYLSWVSMPAMDATYSYKPVYEAYRVRAPSGEPVGQFANWPQPERSVLFLFGNRAIHLNSDASASLFLSQPGRRFVIVDRNRLGDLRRIAKQLNVPLHIVFDDHPYARLVSNEPDPLPTRSNAILGELPPGVPQQDAVFGGKLHLLGYHANARSIQPGQEAIVTIYAEAVGPMEQDWQLMVQAKHPAHPERGLRQAALAVSGTVPTRKWREGRIYVSELRVRVPADCTLDSFFIWFAYRDHGGQIPLLTSSPHDGNGFFRGPLILVGPKD